MDLWPLIAAERVAFADLLDGLAAEDWQEQSLCPAWTVHGVVAHLVSAQASSTSERLRAAWHGRGVPSRVTEVLAARYARTSPPELVAWIRAHPDSRFSPPGMGPRAPLTDVMVHRVDVAVPLALPLDRPATSWVPVLDFLLGRTPMLGVVKRGFPAAAYVATDVEWRRGAGPEVRGTADVLGSVLAGRAALADRLEGPGAAAVRSWVTS
ncbi:maleylpyruvate isomerase family mycothiol-dependent enzyme [Nocardioides sp. GXZ039]|uniref:maleylpyruvate isomerase family mycothiol-dependent enzyme n=1 Tax=Nocardioides sp. GXZ039 TaxID=3136018 RepID=UPI0030F488E6